MPAPDKKVLLVSNDYPPVLGGIQSYVRDFLSLVNAPVTVLASRSDVRAAAAYDAATGIPTYRYPTPMLLPTPAVAAAMSAIIAAEGITTVWFGAAAPLALLAPAARRAGATRIVASTHGHEVGWSMIPGGRQALRRIGDTVDVVTYISEYTRGRLADAFGPHPEWIRMPSGVDTSYFQPAGGLGQPARDEGVDGGMASGVFDGMAGGVAGGVADGMDGGAADGVDGGAAGGGLKPGTGVTVVCLSRLVPRKGQDTLIRVWPEVVARYPDARLVIVGSGPYEARLKAMVAQLGLAGSIRFVGAISDEGKRELLAGADIFAMPCRTRGGGLDVEGLGIVFLEAQAAGLPVIVGRSGGAPETVTSDTGIVVDDAGSLREVLLTLIGSQQLRQRMGTAARNFAITEWDWQVRGPVINRALGLE